MDKTGSKKKKERENETAGKLEGDIGRSRWQRRRKKRGK